MVVIAEPSIHSDMHSEYSVVSGVESVGPEEAERLLAANRHNRVLRPTPVATFARAMGEGRWELNGESIKVAASGELIDGQHRLAAVVRSGATIQTVVVRGLPSEAQETIDMGAKRSLADALLLRGESNSSTVASALKVAWQLERNKHLWNGANYPYPSADELLAYLEDNPGIRQSASVGHRLNDGILRYPPSSAAGLHYLMSRIDADQADEFWTLLNEGTGLLSGHPILTLRQYLVRDLANSRRMATVQRVAFTIKAWNAFRTNRSVRVMKWTRSGDKPEDFPVLK